MSRPQKTQVIKEFTEKLEKLREQEGALEAEAQHWAEEREKLNEQVRSLRTDAAALRADRDASNEQVKELKRQRNENTIKIHEKIEEIKKLSEEKKVLSTKRPSRAHRALQKEIEEIDWTIQTTPLTLQEDKELVEKIQKLDAQLAIHRKLEGASRKISDLRMEVKTIKNESEILHKKLTTNAAVGQEIHGKMTEKIEKSKVLKTKADSMHEQFLRTRERKRQLQEMMTSLSKHISQLKGEIRKEEQKEKEQSENVLRERIEKQARDKLRRGEKLSWEEFQLLAEKGMATQD
jgi:colicin import membrane protein